MSTIHLVCGPSARGVLNSYFHAKKLQGKNVVYEVDDLSLGPIFHVDDKEGMKQRVAYFKRNFRDFGLFPTLHMLKAKKSEKIIVWHARHVSEQILLRYVVYKFAHLNQGIYEVNISTSQFKKTYRVGECNFSEIRKLLGTDTLIEGRRKDSIMKEWKKLRNSKFLLRIMKYGKITDVPESYYDPMILSLIKGGIKSDVRVIGQLLGKIPDASEEFISYRIMELVKQEKVIIKVVNYLKLPGASWLSVK